MLVYNTPQGLARREGNDLAVLDLPHADVTALLADSDEATISQRLKTSTVRGRVPVNDVKVLAPVRTPRRLVLIGANYRNHVQEAGMPMPDAPLFISLADTTLTGPDDDIVLPSEAPDRVDYEGELAIVIGRAGHQIPANRACRHIGGLTAANDVSARDVQLSGMESGRITDLGAVMRAKSFSTFKPLGPAILVGERLSEEVDMTLRTSVNGRTRQVARTSDMIFDIPTIIEYVSRSLELEVGDVLLTGTPGGVGLVTGSYLTPGDVVEVAIDGVGILQNRVVSSPPSSNS